MARETWVYPRNGGEPYLKGSRQAEPGDNFARIMPDLPDFVSPIDQKTYSGRAGMREHNKAHNVVPHADLKGLPYLTTDRPYVTPKAQAQKRKDRIIHMVNSHWK